MKEAARAPAGPVSGFGRLLVSGHLLAKAIRFACIGVLSGAIYALVTVLLVSRLGLPPIPASIAGYCASVPASFLGHRRFSFRSHGRWTAEAARFVATQALNIAVTAGSMYLATGYFASPYAWGMVLAVILVPVANFAVLNLWVFRRQAHRREPSP